MTYQDDKLPPEARDPFDGPASENAYPEDLMVTIDGKKIPMNELARSYNRQNGLVDKAADKPWVGPTDKKPSGEPE